jgi:hypothetical protein
VSPGTRARTGATGGGAGQSLHAEIERAGPRGAGVSAGAGTTTSVRRGAMGEETVPLRPADERRAEREREERLRIVSRRGRRLPSLPGRRATLLALSATGIVAAAAVLVLGSGGGAVSSRPRADLTGAGKQPRSSTRAPAQGSLAADPRHADDDGARSPRHESRGRGPHPTSPARPARRRGRPSHPGAGAPLATPAPQPTAEPATTPEVEAASPPPVPVAEPAPEPAPEPPPAQEPTSKEESKPAGPAPEETQVERQFGFER